jgi:tRNA-dihydrouridine synthase
MQQAMHNVHFCFVQRTKAHVSAKIRIFPDLQKTVAYAKLLEASGASLVAVHGRTRDQKNAAAIRADWHAIRAVKEALAIPVLGNGDVASRADAERMIQETGVDGVLSASPLLHNPALFCPHMAEGGLYVPMRRFQLAQEYLALCEQHPVPLRMVRVRPLCTAHTCSCTVSMPLRLSAKSPRVCGLQIVRRTAPHCSSSTHVHSHAAL